MSKFGFDLSDVGECIKLKLRGSGRCILNLEKGIGTGSDSESKKKDCDSTVIL